MPFPPGHFLNFRPPALYKDCRLGKYDTVVWGRPNGEIKIGRIEKLSKVTKERPDDGSSFDQCGDPHFYYVYPKFHPDESVFKIRPIELKICDRFLRIGFIVKDFETDRIGYVQGIKQQITVRLISNGLILRDLEFRDLSDPWKLNVQFKRPVYYDGWVGRIISPVQRRVALRFVDQKTMAFSFWIAWNELAHILVECGIVKMGTFSFESSGFAFWPGKKYKIPRKVLLNPKYNIKWEGDMVPGILAGETTVTVRVVTTEVLPFRVQWARRIVGFETDKPKEVWEDNEVSQLHFIRPNLISSLGDVRLYRIKSHDRHNFVTEEGWKMVLRRRYCLPRARVPPLKAEDEEEKQEPEDQPCGPLKQNDEVPVEVIYTRSTAEVAWVDGKISRIDSCKLCRIKNEYFEIGSIVEPVTIPGMNTFGVVQQVKVYDKLSALMESSAIVRWFYFGNDEDPEEQTYETELSVKLLRPHSKFNFKSRCCQNVLVTRVLPKQEFTVGFVVNTYPDGKVRVRCVDGSMKRFWPFEISRITADSHFRFSTSDCSGGDEYRGEEILLAENGKLEQSSSSLNLTNWKKALRQASAKNLAWKSHTHFGQDKFSALKLNSSKSVSYSSAANSVNKK